VINLLNRLVLFSLPISKMTNEPVSKKMKLAENNSEAAVQREKETHAAIEKIDGIQSELDSLNDKASEEILQVERKYNKLREPYYNKRADDIAAIQAFWITAFLNHPQISALLTEEDEKALAYMENLSVKENDDIKSGYKVIFTFKENPYFTNKSLEKEIKVNEDGELAGDVTKIDWKQGRNLQDPAVSSQGSFFQWFSDDAPSGIGQDELGEIIKDDLWPNPLQYYLATEEGDEDGEDFGDEEDDDEDGEGGPEEEYDDEDAGN